MIDNGEATTVPLATLWRSLQARWLMLVAGTVAGAAVGVMVAVGTTPVYAANARVLPSMADASPGSGGFLPVTFVGLRVPEYTSFAESGSFLQRVVDTYSLPVDAEELKSDLSMTSPRDTSIIDVTVHSSSPVLAADLSNVVAAELAQVIEEREAQLPVRVTVVEQAAVPTAPISPFVLRMVTQSAVIGLIVGAAAAVALAARRSTARRERVR